MVLYPGRDATFSGEAFVAIFFVLRPEVGRRFPGGRRALGIVLLGKKAKTTTFYAGDRLTVHFKLIHMMSLALT